MKLQPHPFLSSHPMMPSHEIDALAQDIKKHGQRVPIVIYGGKILDGRNRYEACCRLGIEPRIVQFTKAKPKDYVASVNYFRKHWTTGERAHFAALMSLKSEVGRHEEPESNAPNGAVISQDEAAKTMSVSRRSVQRAKAKITKKHDLGRTADAVDDKGDALPNGAVEYWNRKSEAQAILSQISKVRTEIKKLMPDDPMWIGINLNGVIADLNSAYNRFAASVPSYVCPVCKGEKPDKCKCCKGKGVLSEYFYRMVPEEMRR